MSETNRQFGEEKAGDDLDIEGQKHMLRNFWRVVRRYGGKLMVLFAGVSDPRQAKKIIYSLPVLLFTGVLMFACQLGARRQINHQLRGSTTVRKKYGLLFAVGNIPHGDTLNYSYRKLKVEEMQEVVCRVTEKVMAQEELKKWRLFGIYYLIAIDGTGFLTYHERHCDFCLTRRLNNGQILYYHPVLDAKWVTANGYAFSLMTEFIENRDPQASKQDCELKAFYRLSERLKKRFPKVPFCLLLDGLFAGGPTLGVCEKYDWMYFITLTDNDLSSVNQEFETLLTLPPETTRDIQLEHHIQQTFRWVNGIEYVDGDQHTHRLNVLECVETCLSAKNPAPTKFKWLTNFTLLSTNVFGLANQAGRLRWKIENEGFNLQKNGGFALEHVFSQNENAHKVFYLLLQLAVTFFQLMAKSDNFIQDFPKGVGSLKNIAFRLLEAWRNLRLDDQAFLALLAFPNDTS